MPIDQRPEIVAQSSNDFFESIGKKVEGAAPTSDGKKGGHESADNNGNVVDELESLCMNCHEDVRPPVSFVSRPQG